MTGNGRTIREPTITEPVCVHRLTVLEPDAYQVRATRRVKL